MRTALIVGLFDIFSDPPKIVYPVNITTRGNIKMAEKFSLSKLSLKEGEMNWSSDVPISPTSARARYAPPWADVSIIGIAGSSGSGKSTLSRAIVSKLSLPWVVILSMVSTAITYSGWSVMRS